MTNLIIAMMLNLYCPSEQCVHVVGACYEKFSEIYPDMEKKEVLSTCIESYEEGDLE